MYQLFASVGGGSFPVHVILRELEVPFELRLITYGNEEIKAANPLGQVPTLKLPNGDFLFESSAILITSAETHPSANLLPPVTSCERREVLRWLGFCNSNLHPAFLPYYYPQRYHPAVSEIEAVQQAAIVRIRLLLTVVNQHLAGRTWLTDSGFTIADAYMGLFGEWIEDQDIREDEFPHFTAFIERFRSRASVQAAKNAEGW